MGCDRFKVDATKWGYLAGNLENSTPAPVVAACLAAATQRRKITGNAGAGGIASPKPPALGAARTIIRRIRPTLYAPRTSYQRSLVLSPELPSLLSPWGIVTRHWIDLDPPSMLRASFDNWHGTSTTSVSTYSVPWKCRPPCSKQRIAAAHLITPSWVFSSKVRYDASR